MKFLSICVPTYNRAKELVIFFESIDHQDSIEIVICDDGSNDNTADVVKLYSKKFTVKYTYQINMGRAAALYSAINLAEGEFIIIMDSDDYFVKNGLSLMIEAIKNNRNNDAFLFGVMVKKKYAVEINSPPKCITNYIAVRADYKIKGDLKEVVRSVVLKKIIYHPSDNCRRIPTSLLWASVAESVDCVSFDIIVAFKEYLSGGMSDKILELKTKNSEPMVRLYLLLALSKRYRSRLYRWRYRVLWARYSFHKGCIVYTYWWQKFIAPLGWMIFIVDRQKLKSYKVASN
jgi:glycosyltransferase involved in cell wall biosynthesis